MNKSSNDGAATFLGWLTVLWFVAVFVSLNYCLWRAAFPISQPPATASSTLHLSVNLGGALTTGCVATFNEQYSFIEFGAAYGKPCTITIPTNHTAMFYAFTSTQPLNLSCPAVNVNGDCIPIPTTTPTLDSSSSASVGADVSGGATLNISAGTKIEGYDIPIENNGGTVNKSSSSVNTSDVKN
jgi:hypothetical protein